MSSSNPNKKHLNFCSSSPFGFSQNQKVKYSAIEVIEKYGLSANLEDNEFKNKLEKKIAENYRYPYCTTYSGATLPNFALISFFTGRKDFIFYDVLDSASLIDSIEFSKARSISYKHNDMVDLEKQVKLVSEKFPNSEKLIISSSIFINEGNTCPLNDIIKISNTYNCKTLIDDSYGLGYIDGESRNILDFFKITDGVDFITGSFSNLLESNGGFIVYSEKYKLKMEELNKKYKFDSITANTANAVYTSLNLLDQAGNESLRLKLKQNIDYWKNGLKNIGMYVIDGKSNCIPINVPDDITGIKLQQCLQNEGLYVSYESYQKSENKYKLLTSVDIKMTKSDIDEALEIIGKVVLNEFTNCLISQPSVNYLPISNPIKEKLYNEEKKNTTLKDESNFGFTKPKFAIIGMGCHFPEGITSKEKFWEMLEDGRCITKDIPKERWDKDEWYSKEPIKGTMQTKRGAFLENPYEFDNKYFSISIPEAKEMSPEQRWLCELTVETLEDANIKPEALRGSKTGVFIGSSGIDYLATQISHANDINSHSPTGFELSILANRLSYVFDLQGPSISCNTACSSAFSALNIGLNAMITNDCDMAFVAGSNFMNCPGGFVAFSQLRVVSPDGSCKPFDEKANGYVRLEGAGMILIKPYEKAVRDGDKIYCAIMGCGSNEDGRSPSLTMPSYQSQFNLLRHVCEKSGVEPSSIDYVEAHGTGTKVGDPIEANAIGDAYGKGKGIRGPDAEPLLVSSVKGNTGHGENSSGIVGIIKASLMLYKRMLVPTVAYYNLNKAIDAKKLGIKVVDKLEKWTAPHTLNVAVNSFGFGGANTNTLLQETKHISKENVRINLEKNRPIVATISGYNEKIVMEQLKQWQSVPLNEVLPQLYISSTCREDSYYRLAFTLDNPNDFSNCLKDVLQGKDNINVVKKALKISTKPSVSFAFSGQGSQYPDMGRQLYQSNKYFADIIDYCDQIVKVLNGKGLIEETGLFRGESITIDQDTLSNPHFSFLAIGITQLALIEMWKTYGIQPSSVFGHSMGEVAAAYAAGILTLEDAVLLLYHYGRIDKNLDNEESSGMIALGCSVEDAINIYLKGKPNVYLSAINSNKDVTIAGDINQLKEIVQEAKKNRVFSVELKIKKAFHSPYIKSAKDTFINGIKGIGSRVKEPKVPFISSTLGQEYKGPFDEYYWWTNIINPVNFSQAAKIAHKYSNNVLEIGPTPVLGIYLSEEYSIDQLYFSLSKKARDGKSISKNLARMYVNKCSNTINLAQYWKDNIQSVEGATLDTLRSIDYDIPKHVWDHRDLRKTYTAMIGINPEKKECYDKETLWKQFQEEMKMTPSTPVATLTPPPPSLTPKVQRIEMPAKKMEINHKPAAQNTSPVKATPVAYPLNKNVHIPNLTSKKEDKLVQPVQPIQIKRTVSNVQPKTIQAQQPIQPAKPVNEVKENEMKPPPFYSQADFKKIMNKTSIKNNNSDNQKLHQLKDIQMNNNEYLDKKIESMYTSVNPEPVKVHHAKLTYNENVQKLTDTKKNDILKASFVNEKSKPLSSSPQENNDVIIEVTDKLVHIVLNRPEANNSFTENMLDRIFGAIDINKVLLIESSGEHFSTGWDLNQGGFESNKFESSIKKFGDLHKLLESVIQPIIVICKGNCRGGAMIFPFMADYVLAYENATFGFPEVRRGGAPAVVTVAALNRLSRTNAKCMMLLGNPINVVEAKNFNLVDFICHDQESANAQVRKLLEKFMNLNTMHIVNFNDSLSRERNLNMESSYLRMAMENFTLQWDTSKELVKAIDLEEGIVVLEMNSPQNFNGMNLDISKQLHACVDQLKKRTDVKCVILRGYKRHFCTGADPSWVANIKGKTHFRMAYEVYQIYRDYASILELNIPVIGMLNGRIVGGGLALSLNCDWRVALDTTTIDFGNMPRGVCPGMMLSRNMEDFIKHGNSLGIYLQPGNYSMSSVEAKEKGIIQELASSFEELQEKALIKARELVRAAKSYQGIDRSILLMRTPLNEELIMKEAYLLADCAVSTDMAKKSEEWKTFGRKQNVQKQ